MLFFVICALLLQPVLSLVVLVPLYIYPSNGAVAWQSLITVIRNHPGVQYLIIINPNSGPGPKNYPDANYVNGVSQLHAFANVKMIGYVDTLYMRNSIDTVNANVDKYASWTDYATNITLKGIFFDDMTDSADQSAFDYMSSVSNHARSAFAAKNGNNDSTIVFNPGCKVDSTYFQWANYIVEFENALADYPGLATIKRNKPKMRQKQAIIAHSADVGSTQMQTILKPIYKQSIGAVYMTQQCCYNGIDTQQLSNVSSIIASLKQNGK